MGHEIKITRLDGGRFDVEVVHASGRTSHTVHISEGMLDELGIEDVGGEEVVRESFAFLLEREPATSILPEFGLDVISRYFPEYPDELAKRVGGRS